MDEYEDTTSDGDKSPDEMRAELWQCLEPFNRIFQGIATNQQRWREIRKNKKNQQTAKRIEKLGKKASPEHKAVLMEAMKLWAEAVHLERKFSNRITDLLTSEAVYYLAFCEEGHEARSERTVAVSVALALAKGKTVEQCKRLFKSKAAYFGVEAQPPAPFKVGDYVRYKDNPDFCLYTVAEIQQLPGWDELAIVPRTPKGQRIFPEACSGFILDSEYQQAEVATRYLEEMYDNVTVSIEGGALRLNY